ncbi:hypothetical protein CDAR_441511 [Caerostris darwini]|uniref:Uncharacterized protein n=1 Tax=Caerostris darwini TaxID=1538125 RepID=A0AAV4NTP9_9ARAC|nr:hypothetical protein CDAR_441511 [Caerostris darwini]
MTYPILPLLVSNRTNIKRRERVPSETNTDIFMIGLVSNHFSKRFRRCSTSIPLMARLSLLIRFPNREHLISQKRFSSFGHSASRDLISIRQTLLGDSGRLAWKNGAFSLILEGFFLW